MRRIILQRMHWTAVAIMALAMSLAGCVAERNGVGRSVSTEPPVIVIRNRTSVMIREVNLRPAQSTTTGSAIAVISPVPANGQQLFIRRSNPKPLPREVTVSWVANTYKMREQTVSLKELLRDSTGQPDETLVFEIDGKTVTVNLEYSPSLGQ